MRDEVERLLAARESSDDEALGASALDDLVQDVWLAHVKNPPRAIDEFSWRQWVRVVGRRIIDRWESRFARERRDEPSRTRDEHRDATSVHGTDGQLERRFRRAAVAAAVERLKSPYRDALKARFFEGLSIAEIATRLGAEDGLVRTWIHRARAQVRRDLESRFGRRGDRLLGALPWLRRLRLFKASGWSGAAFVLCYVIASVPWIGSQALPPSDSVVRSDSPRTTITLATLPMPGEARDELDLTRELRVVSAHDGAPIAGAAIHIATFTAPVESVATQFGALSTTDRVERSNAMSRLLRQARPRAQRLESIGHTDTVGLFEGHASGVDLLVEAPGFAPKFVPWPWAEDVELDRLARAQILVTDPTGTPSAAVRVTAKTTTLVGPREPVTLLPSEVAGAMPPRALTDGLGIADIADVPENTPLQFEANAHRVTHVIDGTPIERVTIVAPHPGRIEGTVGGDSWPAAVYLIAEGEPRARAVATRVQPDGTFAIDDVPAGTHSLELRYDTDMPELARAVQRVVVHAHKIARADFAPTPGASFALTVTSFDSISTLGRVQLFQDGRCVARATLQRRQTPNGTRPAAYCEVIAPPGEYALCIQDSSRPIHLSLVRVPGNATIELEPQDRTAPITRTIRGQLVAQGAACAGEQIEARPLGTLWITRAFTDEFGRFTARVSEDRVTSACVRGFGSEMITYVSPTTTWLERELVIDASPATEELHLVGRDVPEHWWVASEWQSGEHVTARRPRPGCRSQLVTNPQKGATTTEPVVVVECEDRVWIAPIRHDAAGRPLLDLDACTKLDPPSVDTEDALARHLPRPRLFLGRDRPYAPAYGVARAAAPGVRLDAEPTKVVFVDRTFTNAGALRMHWVRANGSVSWTAAIPQRQPGLAAAPLPN